MKQRAHLNCPDTGLPLEARFEPMPVGGGGFLRFYDAAGDVSRTTFTEGLPLVFGSLRQVEVDLARHGFTGPLEWECV